MSLSIAKITNATASATATISASVTTTSAGRLIVVIGAENNSGTAVVFSGVSGGGLTWARRSTKSNASGHGQTMEVWYADAASTLSAVTITATASANWDDAAMSIELVTATVGVIGWDTNASLPTLLSDATGSTALVTDLADYIALATNGDPASTQLPTGSTPSWLASLDFASNGGGVNFQGLAVAAGSPTGALIGFTTDIDSGTTTVIDALAAVGTTDLTTAHLHIAKITNSTHSGGTTITASVTTTSAGRLIVVVSAENSTTTAVAFSSVSGGGLTWARRSTIALASSSGQAMEVWYADAASTLSTVTITATMTASYDDATMSVELVTADAGYTIAWDTNASVPKVLTATPGTGAITTDSRNTMVLLASSNPNSTTGNNPRSPSPGWLASLDSVTNTGGARIERLSVAGGSPTGVAVGWTSNVKVGSVTAIDAIVAPVASGVSGSAARTVTAALTATGVVGASSTATSAVTAAASAAGLVATSTTAALAVSATASAAGVVARSSTAALAVTAGLTTTGATGTSSAAALGTAAALTASGAAGWSSGAALATAATLSCAGIVATNGDASLATTATLTASAVHGPTGAAALANLATFTATGLVVAVSDSALALSVTSAATALVGTASDASLGSIVIVTAAGVIGVSAGAIELAAHVVVLADALALHPTPTPTDRVYSVPGELRTASVAVEQRTFAVPGENRTVEV